MTRLSLQARSVFQRIFPERQIYHRSGGTVHYVSISSWQQMIMAVVILAVASWGLYTTAHYLFYADRSVARSNSGDVAAFRRWRGEQEARLQLLRQSLEERTNEWELKEESFEARHKQLELLLDDVYQQRPLEPVALNGDGADFLITPSIEEADIRQARALPKVQPTSRSRRRHNALARKQDELLAHLEELTVAQAETARGVLQLTPVNFANIDGKNNEGMGGPFEAISAADLGLSRSKSDRDFANRLVVAKTRLDEARYYSEILERLPLAQPLGRGGRLTSQYGIRRDPINGRPAMHNGIDMGQGWNAPIYATGPGKVIRAQNVPGYGRLVVVDHGYGFTSKYAHMRRKLVQKGDTVETGQQVGTMGSSGRSTGPHLHYEVRHNGDAFDPVKFLKAGKHVHKNN